MRCPNCGNEAGTGNYCQVCGAQLSTIQATNNTQFYAQPEVKSKKPIYKKWWFWVIAVFALFIIVGIAGSSGDDKKTDETGESTINPLISETESVFESALESTSETTTAVTTTTTITTTTIATTADNLTMGQKNALKKADSYLSFSAFSYKGLVEQLEFEGFTSEEAKYAADNCGADWNEQAAKKAKSYLSFSSFSRDGLIEQLEFEGFTHEQAVYGVEAVGY